MQIVNADLEDIETIFDLYDRAIEFQKTKFDKHWLGFDVALVEREIRENRLWKIIENERIACIFSITFSDPLLWGEKEDNAAIYIHRIVTNPEFRGRGFVRIITNWAKDYARSIGKKFIRMDTWGDNRKLIDYYKDCGFDFLGLTTPAKTENLPKHYEGISLSLFEINLDKDSC
jgi:ribosomal protein S18 acetylase RimI-like enzyme